MLKKLFIFITFYFLVIPSTTVFAENKEKSFIVTAYYSPLPNQEYYLTGNYEEEIALNGGGIRGASGKEVFEGMLAAPKNYDFGTKIYLEGIGTGVVEDRGGAIVEAGERGYTEDRIDVWMGHGDEGLKKALSWGKRKVKGLIIDKSIDTEVKIEKIKIPEIKSNFKISVFSRNIGNDSSKEDIKMLQELFEKEGLYNGEINGIYNDKIFSIVYEFQLKKGIVKSKNDYGAGFWGNRTRYLFFKNLDANLNEQKSKKVTIKIDKKKEVSKVLNIFDTVIYPNSEQDKIKLLQKKFKEIGMYSGNVNGSYKDIKEVLIKYQLKNKIIDGKNSIGAGYFGPKTRALLKADYEKFLDNRRKDKEKEEKVKELAKLSNKEAEDLLKEIGNPKFGQSGKNVRTLQNLLKTLGYFEGKDTAIFGDKTKDSLVKYQIDKKLVVEANNPLAGKIGDKTKEVIKNDLSKILLERKMKDANIMAYNTKKAGN